MWNSAFTSSGQAIGKEFIDKLLYVQHVDKKKDKTSELSELTLRDLLADDRKVCEDSTNSTENGGNPDESNLDILKSFLKDRITEVSICSNPLPISFEPLPKPKDAFHAFVVFTTLNTTNSKKKKMWWSLEKNTQYIVLQQSTQMNDVLEKINDAKEGQRLERYGEVKLKKWAMGNARPLEDLLQVIWEYNQLSDPYHLLYSNCQNFASFIFEKLNGQKEEWSTRVSSIFGRLNGRKKKTGIELNAIMHKSMVNDDKFDFYKAMMEGRRKDFEELINDLTIESLNSVDSQGYTLLEWATVFSSSHWPIDGFLKEKGAQIQSGKEELFRRNVFFIALQYLPSNKESKFLSFDGIDMNGVNGTGDTALHLALYEEKWKIAEDILCKFEDDGVNLTNSLGETALHLAAKLNCKKGLFKKILNRTDSGNVNKADGIGWTALHYAIDRESEIQVRKLLNHKDVNVNIKNDEDNRTALHLASKWPTIPADLFEIILKNSTDVINAQDVNGNTALHYAIMTKSETAVKKLLNHKGVNVKNNRDVIALHLASNWQKIPVDLFQNILKYTNNINAQDEDGCTALHYTICKLKSKTAVKELLTRSDFKFNVKDKGEHTALHYASMCKDIPSDLFNLVLEKSTDIINAQDVNGNTALHFAIRTEFVTAVEKLLNHENVNVANNEKILPLHLASMCKNIPMDLFKQILQRTNPENINAKDNDGKTALHWAIWKLKSKTKVEELLNDDRVEVNVETHEKFTPLHYASCWKDIPMNLFKQILKETKDINAKTKNGWTALHTAVLNNFQEAITALLEDYRVDVNVKNKKKHTALYYCLDWEWPYKTPADLSERIRIESLDINAQDEVNVTAKKKKETTALHLVCMSRDDIPDNLIKIIIRQSSDINAQDNKGDTALHIAIRNRNDVAVKELRKREDLDVDIKNNKNETASDQKK